MSAEKVFYPKNYGKFFPELDSRFPINYLIENVCIFRKVEKVGKHGPPVTEKCAKIVPNSIAK